jgi:hypothetical protein
LHVLPRQDYYPKVDGPEYSWAPFGGKKAIQYDTKKIFVCSPLKDHYVHDIIHEMGHVFASKVEPGPSDEFTFLGWEMAVAQHIGLSWSQWQTGNNYQVAPQKNHKSWAQEIHHFHEKHLLELYEERLIVARQQGLVDFQNRPHPIR